VGSFAPPHFGRFSRAPGTGQTSKTHPNKSGQTAFKYPATRLLSRMSRPWEWGPARGRISRPEGWKSCPRGGTTTRDENPPWVPEGSLAGFLGAAFLKYGRPWGPRKALKKWGASPRTFLKVSRAPGAGQTSKMQPTKPNQTAFKFPGNPPPGRQISPTQNLGQKSYRCSPMRLRLLPIHD
jgi:hypothetical protein